MLKNRLVTLAGTLALFAVVGKFYAIPALADSVKTAVVTIIQDRDSRARNYYQQWNLSCGYSIGSCNIDLPAVPAGKRLVIDHISGFVLTGGANDLWRVALWAKGQTPLAYVPFNPSRPNNTNTYSTMFAQEIFAVFDTNQIPSIQIDATGGAFAWQGTASGYMIDIP
jgi:hypothetical protein